MQGKRMFIGIDGGGTKTACVIADEHGHILAKAIGKAGNMQANPIGHIEHVLKSLFSAVLTNSGTTQSDVVAITVSLAGCDRPADKAILRHVLSTFLPKGVQVQTENDALAALAVGTWGKPGVILIAGTGSIAYTLSPEGKMIRAGGWGYLLGDEGSGYAIGREGLSAILKAYDESEQATSLTDRALKAFSLGSPPNLVPFIYSEGESKQKIASFSRVVFAAAKSGDAVSLRIVNEAIEDLHKLVTTALVKSKQSLTTPIVIGGGLFSEPFFKEKFLKRMGTTEVIHPTLPPVIGALIMAMTAKGIPITDAIKTTLQQSWNKIEKGDGAREE